MVALAGSLYLILDSRAHAQVIPEDLGASTLASAPPRLRVGPGFLTGTF
jgi:hypothetical protein